MFVQTEITPNPKTVKFIPGKEVSPKNSISLGKNDDLEVFNRFGLKFSHPIENTLEFIKIKKEKRTKDVEIQLFYIKL